MLKIFSQEGQEALEMAGQLVKKSNLNQDQTKKFRYYKKRKASQEVMAIRGSHVSGPIADMRKEIKWPVISKTFVRLIF